MWDIRIIFATNWLTGRHDNLWQAPRDWPKHGSSLQHQRCGRLGSAAGSVILVLSLWVLFHSPDFIGFMIIMIDDDWCMNILEWLVLPFEIVGKHFFFSPHSGTNLASAGSLEIFHPDFWGGMRWCDRPGFSLVAMLEVGGIRWQVTRGREISRIWHRGILLASVVGKWWKTSCWTAHKARKVWSKKGCNLIFILAHVFWYFKYGLHWVDSMIGWMTIPTIPHKCHVVGLPAVVRNIGSKEDLQLVCLDEVPWGPGHDEISAIWTSTIMQKKTLNHGSCKKVQSEQKRLSVDGFNLCMFDQLWGWWAPVDQIYAMAQPPEVFLLMLAPWHRYICWTCPREVHCWKQSSQGFKRSELGEDWETVWNIHVSGAAGRIHQLDTRQRSKNPRVLPISTPYFSGCSSVSLLKNCTCLRLRNGGYGVHVSAAKRLNTIAIWNSVHICSQHPDISWSFIISHYIKFWTFFPTSYYYIP